MAPPAVPERLAQAQAAEVRPRSRAAELQAAFNEAVAAKRYGDADRLQAELHEARLALAEAEGITRGIRAGIDAAEQARAAERKALDDARRHDEAQRVIGDAIAAEKRALDGIEEALADARANLDAALDAYSRALQWEAKTGRERQRVIDAKVMCGEAAAPGPRATASNRASALGERDPLLRELRRWNGQWRT